MSLYILAFSPDQHYRHINSGSFTDFVEITYKTKEGPLGFNLDPNGGQIFRALVQDTIWLKASGQTFHLLDAAYLETHIMYHFDGLFLDQIVAEIEKEESNKVIRKKNFLLRRYDKPVLEEKSSIFSPIYDRVSRKYDGTILDSLYNDGIAVALGHQDSLGTHFIFHRTSIFMERLIHICKELEMPILYMYDEKEIPSW